jgi:hypothetical protein
MKNMETEIQPTIGQLPQEAGNQLFADVCNIIEGSRYRLATTINAKICLLHWHIGWRIKTEVLDDKRAEYGKRIVKNSAKNLLKSTEMAGVIVNFSIVYALRILFRKMKLYRQCVHNS